MLPRLINISKATYLYFHNLNVDSDGLANENLSKKIVVTLFDTTMEWIGRANKFLKGR